MECSSESVVAEVFCWFERDWSIFKKIKNKVLDGPEVKESTIPWLSKGYNSFRLTKGYNSFRLSMGYYS